MRFKLDENLGERGLRSLREAGHDVATVAEQNMRSASDRTLIDVCAAEDRCLVTLDLMQTLVSALGQADPRRRLWIVEPGRIREHAAAANPLEG